MLQKSEKVGLTIARRTIVMLGWRRRRRHVHVMLWLRLRLRHRRQWHWWR